MELHRPVGQPCVSEDSLIPLGGLLWFTHHEREWISYHLVIKHGNFQVVDDCPIETSIHRPFPSHVWLPESAPFGDNSLYSSWFTGLGRPLLRFPWIKLAWKPKGNNTLVSKRKMGLRSISGHPIPDELKTVYSTTVGMGELFMISVFWHS